MNFDRKDNGCYYQIYKKMTLTWIMLIIFTQDLVVVDSYSTGTRSPDETCQPGYYWKEWCQECPSICESCESNTTCTLCKIGYYGQDCLEKCKCKGEGCDKVTGYCQQGCVHGRYGKECELPCPGCGTCKTCARNTGQCLLCNDNYFLQDGKCKICSHGCSICVTERKCTQCKESHFLLDGRCESCMQGCRLCNTSNYCILCNTDSIALFDGFCLVRCPAYTTNTNLPDTHHVISTCEEHTYSYNYTESGFCQQQSKEFPFAEFRCIYQCNKSCKPTCILPERKQQHEPSRVKVESTDTTETPLIKGSNVLVVFTIFLAINIVILAMLLKTFSEAEATKQEVSILELNDQTCKWATCQAGL